MDWRSERSAKAAGKQTWHYFALSPIEGERVQSTGTNDGSAATTNRWQNPERPPGWTLNEPHLTDGPTCAVISRARAINTATAPLPSVRPGPARWESDADGPM